LVKQSGNQPLPPKNSSLYKPLLLVCIFYTLNESNEKLLLKKRFLTCTSTIVLKATNMKNNFERQNWLFLLPRAFHYRYVCY